MDKEQAKSILRNVVNPDVKEAIETLIPELNESEDERNWKAVLDCVKDDALKEWLIKQKEQKHLSKFDVDAAFDAREPRDIWEYIKEFCDKFGRIPKDMDELDELVSYVMVKKQKEQKPAEWSKEDEKHLYNAIEAVKYAYDVSAGSSGAQCVEFLKSLRPQPKHELGEENEKLWVHDDDIFLDAAKMIVEDSPRKSYGGVNKKSIVPWFYSLKERLKSLRPFWKPSEEQMNALKVVAHGYQSDDLNAIESLLNDLQKLL